MKKIVGIIAGIMLAGVVLLFVTKDVLIKTGLTYAVSHLTGLETKVYSVNYDFPSSIMITECVLLNPEGFQEKEFVNIQELYLSFNIVDFLKGKGVHFTEIRLAIQSVHIEKNSAGVSNLAFLNTGSKPNDLKKIEQPAPSKPVIPFLLEEFEFSLRNVSYQDSSGLYGASGLPDKLSVDMKIEKRTYKDIHDPQLLTKLILAEIVRAQTFGRLLSLNPRDLLGKNLYGIFNSGQAFIGEQSGALFTIAESVVLNPVTSAQSALIETQGVAEKTVSGLWNTAKSLASEE